MAIQEGTPINIIAMIATALALPTLSAPNDRAKPGDTKKCIYIAPLYEFLTYDHDRFLLSRKWHYQQAVIPAQAGIQSSFSGNMGIESYKGYG